jgi:hypothetical protein
MCLFCIMNSVTRDFTTFGQKWGDNQAFGNAGGLISYSFATQNFPNQFGVFDSFISELPFQEEIITSLASWENVADIRFVPVSDSESVDIRFGWRDIDGKAGVLGQTTVPSLGPLNSVVVAMDSSEDWVLGGDASADKIDFSSSVTHEIGHAIGIDHSLDANALMNAAYSTTIFNIQKDDIDAAVTIYGSNDIRSIDVFRFYNPTVGGHLFTADVEEKNNVDGNIDFISEGTGFSALSRLDDGIDNSVPVYRFFNSQLGSHFFTTSEIEKSHVESLDNFIFEGTGFRAFNIDSSATIPIYRFFNKVSGGHFFTANENEKDVAMEIPQLNFEGEAFYAFADWSF